MLDPGRYIAEAIYFIQYTLAQILWAMNRALLAIAVIAESVNTWLTTNAAYFVELVVNALSAPLGGMLILALTALGSWYLVNNIVATERWVDPSKLVYYATLSLLFFGSPVAAITGLERLRMAINNGIDPALISAASGDLFDTAADGTDTGLPAAIPDTNSDGVIASFDLVSAFISLANLTELDSNEFPTNFEATYFPYGDPSSINLADEADREEAKSLASEGIQRLLFALFAVPTAIAEHFLRLALTSTAMFIYIGLPFAMLFAFFIFTQAYLGAYLRQFLRLLIETFFSVLIIVVAIILLVSAAQKGVGFYIGASLIALAMLLWRIKSAFRLAAASLDLFGGGMLTGGAGAMQVVNTGRQMVGAGVSLAGAALTGGASVALGSAALASAAALRTDAQNDGRYLQTDPAKADGRVRQLKTIAGYSFGRNQTVRRVIEGSHEVRTLTRNLRDGEVQDHQPDLLDYMRAGSSMSGMGSSPWLAMRLSPSLRTAYDEIGGSSGYGGHPLGIDADADGAPVSFQSNQSERIAQRFSDISARSPIVASDAASSDALTNQFAALEQAIATLTTALQSATPNGQTQRPTRDNAAAFRPRDDSAENPASSQIPVRTAAPNLAEQSGLPRHFQPSQSTEHPASSTPATRTQDTSTAPVISFVPTSQANPPNANTALNDPVRSTADINADDRQEVPSTSLTQPTVTTPSSRGTVHFEELPSARREAIERTLQQAASDDPLPRQAAERTLTTYIGEQNAQQITEAVQQHSAESVTLAMETVSDVVTGYQSRNVTDESILQAFQTGEGIAAVRATNETPLTNSQLTAVADTVLLPSRQLSRSELVGVIGKVASDEKSTDKSVAAALGSPVGFGGQTGNVRGVLKMAQALELSPNELTQLADQISQGMRRTATLELVSRGTHPAVARELVADIAAIPDNLTVPQTTAASAQGDVQDA